MRATLDGLLRALAPRRRLVERLAVLVAAGLLLGGCESPRPSASPTAAANSTPPAPTAVATAASGTPTAGPDDRFGVILTDASFFQRTLDLLGVSWYLDYSFRVDDIPAGRNKALKVSLRAKPDTAAVQAAARTRPGSHWLISNEPNVPGQDDATPEAYAAEFYRLVTAIRQADPKAYVVAPEVLNFETTCSNCAGYPQGRAWIDAFRLAYRSSYGGEPPIDAWSLHTYNIDWNALPQRDYATQAREILAFRRYLDGIPEHKDKPIWLTEFSIVWGFEGVRWQTVDGELKASPTGAYRTDLLVPDLTQMLNWLKTNGPALHLERWFLFASHAYKEPWATQPTGIALVEGTGAQAQRTEFGDAYRTAAGGR